MPVPSGSAAGAGRTLRRALDAGRAFLDGYVAPDGRTVRHDQGGDTVSEGQAYAMLVAVGLRDRDRFDAVWRWTGRHLLRRDGLLSWRWAEGCVVGADSAADADLDAAWALALAGRAFGVAEHTEAAVALGRAVLEHETVPLAEGAGRILTAGTWARETPVAVNPSYFNPAAEHVLWRLTGDARWRALVETQRGVLRSLTRDGSLPPDWARVDADGAVTAAPGGGAPVPAFGLDAARIPVRLAASPEAADREIAARLWPALSGLGPGWRGRHTLSGEPLVDWTSPVVRVGAAAAAAAAAAAGHPVRAERLLAEAAVEQRRWPTYFGAAWVALGRLMLQTDRLDACG